MRVTKEDHRELFSRIMLTTIVAIPVAALLVFVSILAALSSGDSSIQASSRAAAIFCYPWIRIIRASMGDNVSDIWVFLGMGLQIVIYAWIWSIGRFYKINPFLLILIIAGMHLIGWSMAPG